MDFTINKSNNKNYIKFSNPQYIGLQEVLNTIHLYSITLEDILNKIEKAEQHECSVEQIGTERTLFEISKNEVVISDVFEGIIDEDDVFPTITIQTKELKEILNDFISYG